MNTAVFNGTSANGVAPMSSSATEAAGVSSAGTHQSGDQAGGRSYIVRADDPVSSVFGSLNARPHLY